jgi:hypothetical protein
MTREVEENGQRWQNNAVMPLFLTGENICQISLEIEARWPTFSKV